MLSDSIRSRPMDPSTELDLRRKSHRDFAQQLVDRATVLDPADRVLIEAHFRDGVPTCELAALTGDAVRSVRRRVRRLAERLRSDRFLFVARHMHQWPAQRRRVATACILQGRTQRQTAQKLGLTCHTVRRHLDAIDALHQQAGATPSTTPTTTSTHASHP